MINFLEQLVTSIWNRIHGRRGSKREGSGVVLGYQVVEEEVTRRPLTIGPTRRTTHIGLIGKTGSGKSFMLRQFALGDLAASRGFIFFDLHGDATPFLLRAIARQEALLKQQLHEKLILIAPADKEFSVGLNPLEQSEASFMRASEFSQLLKRRWGLDHFGARTDELLRNALYVLSANGLTLLELSSLLTHSGFLAQCLKKTPNAEVRQYFESRFNPLSDAMRATMREPILNKVSAFIGDETFRHIVGQQRSTFSVTEAMDDGRWIIVNLEKGKLGEHAITLGSLLFTIAKNDLFAREKRSLYTLYCDELQNFMAFDSGIETVLSEARKFGIGVVSANQYLGQYPDEMRSAIMSIGTQIYFQLSPGDATQIANALDGGKSLAERLKNLPKRHFVIKSGADHWREGCTATVEDPKADFIDLLNRSRAHYARRRTEVEQEIAERHKLLTPAAREVRDVWE